MACTAQMTRPKEQVGNWNATFPSQVSTVEQSTQFVKKLLAVAVSEIMYLRAIFPEKAFGDRKVEDIDLKILSEQSAVPGACQVIKWMRGCFEALEKKYLRQIQMAIYLDENNPDNAIESYVFNFVYHDGMTTLTCNDEELATASSASESNDIRKATMSLLRTTILLFQNLRPLPESAYLGMKLLYYDEVTPPDYEPEGFKSCDEPSYIFNKKPLNVKVGFITTKYHQLKMRVKTDQTLFDLPFEDEENVQPTNVTSKMSDIQSPPADVPDVDNSVLLPDTVNGGRSPSPHSTNCDMDLDENVLPVQEPGDLLYNISKKARSPDRESEHSNSSFHSMGGLVRCPCDDSEDDGLMIQCRSCGYWQHGVCFAVMKTNDAPDVHFCYICADTKNLKKQPTDFHLHSLSTSAQKELCIWRRSLQTCLEVRNLTAADLMNKMNISNQQANSIMARLENEGFITSGSGRMESKKQVKRDVIKSVGIPKYLVAQKCNSSLSSPSTSADESHSARRNYLSNLNMLHTNKENKVGDLVNETKKLSVSQEKTLKTKPKNTKKRKQMANLNVSLNDSQDLSATQTKRRMKSSSSLDGLHV